MRKPLGYALAGVFAAFIAVGAQLKVILPFSPVPITFQTLFLYLAAGVLGARLSALSAMIYIMLGAFGLPVFAGGGGPLYLIGPTGGYLLGFVVAAFIIGFLIERKSRSLAWIFTSMFLGFLLLCAIGVVYLWLYYNVVLETPMEFLYAFTIGFLPFIPGDFVKCLVAAIIAYRVRGFLAR